MFNGGKLDNVATRSYNYSMQKFKAVGVKNLKNNLSAYLRDVKAGECILVTEHEHVVAELRRPGSFARGETQNSLLEAWILEGKVHPSRTLKKNRHLPLAPFNIPKGTADQLLDEVRGD